jgi:isopenicillin N synthase-like dioxygenase
MAAAITATSSSTSSAVVGLVRTATAAPTRRIPLLNITEYYTNRDAFVEKVRHACHNVGFFMIQHEFGPLAHQMIQESKSFFHRPIDEKLQISYENSPSFRGYMRLGSENTAGQLDYREQIEYAVEYPHYSKDDRHHHHHHQQQQHFSSNESIQQQLSSPVYHHYDRLKKGKNPWPDTIQPTLRPITIEYTKHVGMIADILRDSLCLALQLDPTVLRTKFQPTSTKTDIDIHIDVDAVDDVSHNSVDIPHWVIKLVSYPPPRVDSHDNDDDENDDDESTKATVSHRFCQQGVGAHTDTNFLTLVLQDSVGGLQAYTQGEWIDVSSSNINNNVTTTNTTTTTGTSTTGDKQDEEDNTSCYDILICNLGEQAETWSRGYFLATPHRVIIRGDSVSVNDAINDSEDGHSSTNQRQRLQPVSARTSVPFFYNPCLSATMSPLEEEHISHVRWERPINGYKQWIQQDNIMIPSVGENTFKSLARSHPDVFSRHHPDLHILPGGRIVSRMDCNR